MTTVPLGEAKDHLSEYVSGVERTHDRVTITRHGHTAAVLISADDLAALEETINMLEHPIPPVLQGPLEPKEPLLRILRRTAIVNKDAPRVAYAGPVSSHSTRSATIIMRPMSPSKVYV